MKKIPLVFSLSLLALSSQAAERGHFYAGFQSGWSSLHHGVRQFAQFDTLPNVQNRRLQYKVNRNAMAYGLYAGYPLNGFLALEAGYDYLGQVNVAAITSSDLAAFKHTAHGARVNVKAHTPLTEKLAVFAKAGAAVVQNSYQSHRFAGKLKQNQLSPLLGMGVDYALEPELALRVDYQWLSRLTNYRRAVNNIAHHAWPDVRYRPDAHALTVGLLYRFGTTPPVAEKVKQHFEFSADVLFDFAKSQLKPEAFAALDEVYTHIEQQHLTDARIQVKGYADRIGSQAFNLKLSQKRADNVARYLSSKGHSFDKMEAVGYGRSTEKTGNLCDNIRNRQALIQCLAPDRRVTLDITGTVGE